jgi:hypothetical protein
MKGNIGSCRLSVTALSLGKDVASLENIRWESGRIFAIVFPCNNELISLRLVVIEDAIPCP